MKLTPIDITHKSFSRKMLGIDEQEVTEFLSALSTQMEALIHERNALKESLRDREITLHDLKERDQVLQKTIQTATQMAERMKIDAEREAKLILTDAHQKAELIGRDARESLRKAYDEISQLRR
ncbi:MAG: DivIVA domain-containing protein, partial [Bdellovibrio sp.]